MPTNKNAQLRYQILDRCFSDFSRKYEIQDLVDKVNDALYDLYGTEVSLRQIREDTVEANPSYIIRQKHSAVCSFYTDADLVDLLLKQDNEDFDTDTSIPNRVRQIIEWIMRYFDGRGLVSIPFTGTNIAKCSSSLGEIPQLVPIHVARSMHFCVEVCNNGSHGDEIIANIAGGEAPYLNKSLILNLLNILQWCPSLKRYEKEELKKKVAQYQQETREKRNRIKKPI